MHGPRHAACETPATLSPDGFAALPASSLRDAACKPASPSSLTSPMLISRTTHWMFLHLRSFGRRKREVVLSSITSARPFTTRLHGRRRRTARRNTQQRDHPAPCIRGQPFTAAERPRRVQKPATRQSPAIPGFVGIVVGAQNRTGAHLPDA